MIETIYVPLNSQVQTAIKIQCDENTPHEDKLKAAKLVLLRTVEQIIKNPKQVAA